MSDKVERKKVWVEPWLEQIPMDETWGKPPTTEIESINQLGFESGQEVS